MKNSGKKEERLRLHLSPDIRFDSTRDFLSAQEGVKKTRSESLERSTFVLLVNEAFKENVEDGKKQDLEIVSEPRQAHGEISNDPLSR